MNESEITRWKPDSSGFSVVPVRIHNTQFSHLIALDSFKQTRNQTENYEVNYNYKSDIPTSCRCRVEREQIECDLMHSKINPIPFSSAAVVLCVLKMLFEHNRT